MSSYDRFKSCRECEEAQQKLTDLNLKVQESWKIEEEAQRKYHYACDNRNQLKKDVIRAEGVLEFWMQKNEEVCKDDE